MYRLRRWYGLVASQLQYTSNQRYPRIRLCREPPRSTRLPSFLDMSLDFYFFPASAPCRAVMLTAEAIGVTLNGKTINVLEGEHRTPEYEQLNPRKTIPLLIDGDYKLSESRAIMGYLVDEYGSNERLYPTKPAARALVDQRLHFDIGTLYKSMAAYCYPKLVRAEAESDAAAYEKLASAFDILERYLDNQDYVAGRNMTIADLSLIATVTTAEALEFDPSPYENVSKWMERMKSCVPGYRAANSDGVDILKKVKDDRVRRELEGCDEAD